MEVDTSLPGVRVVRVLEQIVSERGKPAEIITDNGPEFTRLVLDRWAHENGVTSISFSPASRRRTVTSRALTADSETSA